MPQQPAVRAKQKRRATRRLDKWRQKKEEQQAALSNQGYVGGSAQTQSQSQS
ncbi:MAG TPA: hypothetical protein VLS89_05510 [Candidatus Nanopelagicales bacterium]|nr:hypothetical protein [Candidatus Nanopelagicales bacterium]